MGLWLWGVLLGCGSGGGACGEPVMVFAAASLRDVLTEVAAGWEGEVRFNFAGSNVLAMQVESAGAADVFISADQQWMDRLERSGRLVQASRRDLLGNQLAVVLHPRAEGVVAAPEALLDARFRHLSIGDPEAVPAGRYARSWLREVGLWDQLSSKLAPASNVRAALRLVEADPAVVGVVYATDAAASERVQVLMPVVDGPEIRYPAARIARSQSCPAPQAFLEHLEASDAIFAAHGFVPL